LLVALLALLLTASAVRADTIRAFLDNPPDQTGIAGIGTINGWAFATNGAPVTVYMRIDGITQEDSIIPCCSSRADVQMAVEGAPLETSYSGVFNYALLSPGEHAIGVEIRAEGCEPVMLERTVGVAKLGNVEVVENFDLDGAWTGVDALNNDMLIVNATTGTDMDRSANLRVRYSLSAQNTGIIEAYTEDETTGETLHDVQAILNEHCLPCHSSDEDNDPRAGLDLSASNMPGSMIAVRSHQLADTFLINPGHPDTSYLVEKISSDSPSRGGRMPQDMPPLSDAEIETIRDWILGGALIPADFAGHDEDDDHDHEADHGDDSDHDHG
jgi:hypothetical protein